VIPASGVKPAYFAIFGCFGNADDHSLKGHLFGGFKVNINFALIFKHKAAAINPLLIFSAKISTQTEL
jgi:hypothetical protein